jgi:hypothetical protein
MAKPLTLVFRGNPVEVALEKVDRSKLYGYVETEVVDEAGKRCELATLIGDGHSIVGKGGSAIAYLSADGLWKTRSELRPVDVDGKPITPVKSSFDAPIPLGGTATVDDFLSHNIHLIYQIQPAAEVPELLAELKAGTIFRFPFSYRGGVEASPAFLLLGGDGNPFLCVGTPTAIEFIGPTATAPVVSDDTSDAGEEEDALDFSLV